MYLGNDNKIVSLVSKLNGKLGFTTLEDQSNIAIGGGGECSLILSSASTPLVHLLMN